MEERYPHPTAGSLTRVMGSPHPSLRGFAPTSSRPDPLDGIRIRVTATTADAARQMLATGSWMLVVVDEKDQLVGMITRDQLGARRRRQNPRTVVSGTPA